MPTRSHPFHRIASALAGSLYACASIVALCLCACASEVEHQSSQTPSPVVAEAAAGPLALEVTLEGASGDGVVFSRDGTKLLTWDAGSAQVWDTKTWKTVGAPLQHCEAVRAAESAVWMPLPDQQPEKLWRAEFDAAGERVMTQGPHVIVWEVKTGKPLSTPLKHRGLEVSGAALSPDGKWVATRRYDDGEVLLRDAKSGSLEHAFKHRAPLSDVQFNPTGSVLVTTSSGDDCFTYLWDLKTRELRFTLPVEYPDHGHAGRPAMSENGLIVVPTWLNCDIYKIATGERVRRHTTIARRGFSMEEFLISANGAVFKSDASLDAGIWSVKDGELLYDWFDTYDAALDPTGETFVYRKRDSGGVVAIGGGQLRPCPNTWHSAVYSPDGRQIALACWKNTTVLLSRPGKTPRERWSDSR